MFGRLRGFGQAAALFLSNRAYHFFVKGLCMVTVTLPVDKLTAQWRRQILAHRDPQSIAARQGFVAASFIDQSNARSAFVDIENLLVVLLYEDAFHSCAETPQHRVPLRLVAYGASRVPHGVQWGGVANSWFFKDLMLTPQFGARGQRIDRKKSELMSLALKLDHRLCRAARHPAAPWPVLRLPRMWAGYRQSEARNLAGEGPEFEETRRHDGSSASGLFQSVARREFGLVLFPMDWVTGQLEHAVAIFAEMRLSLRQQTSRIERVPDGLIGYQGASAVDFYSSRYRNVRRDATKSSNRGSNKMLIALTGRGEAQLMQTVGCIA